jgi:hypothetical protein
MVYLLEDEFHGDWQGQFATLEAVRAELERRAKTPWDEAPNQPPCTNWKFCHRDYVVFEYDDTGNPWKLLRRIPMLKVSAAGAQWLGE